MAMFTSSFVVVVILAHSALGQVTEPECSLYDHPEHGCTGRCVDISTCPAGHMEPGLCAGHHDQPPNTECCFTVDTDLDCAVKDGNCIATEQCPVTPVKNACPSKPTNVQCCISRPTDTCSGRDYVEHDCMHCICMADSNCQQLNPICRGPADDQKCGPYQINLDYYTHAKEFATGAMGGDWKSCTATFHCSEQAVNGYMKHYATSERLGYTPTCEDFARIHNGGPNGHLDDGTLPYWNKVNTCLLNLDH